MNAVAGNMSAMKRFEGVKQLESVDNQWSSANWYVIILSVLALLVVLFIMVSIARARKGRKAAKATVAGKGQQIGLSGRQIEMIREIADKAGVPNKESVFSIEEAFDKGAEKIIEQNLSKGKVGEEIVELKAELAGLREKIGFKDKKGDQIIEKSARPAVSSSRSIPAGRVVYLTRRANPADSGIETMIIENNDNEIRVKLSGNIKINFGDNWRLRYSYGASVWEFESTVLGYDGNILKLSHSYNIRFVSRRRFESVAVKEQAYLAVFPFAGPAQPESVGVPFFLPMTLTAIAGPWIRLETVHKIESGVRALIIMKIEKSIVKPDSGFEAQIIEDIGEIKYVEQKKDIFIVSVELTGMSDEDIDHLVGISKRAAIKETSEEKIEAVSENPELTEVKTG